MTQQKQPADKHRIPYKRILIPTALLVMLLAVGTLSLAWFNYNRSLQTMTAVCDPIHLYIRAGHGDDVAQLYLGDIDVEKASYADYVFSVESEEDSEYILQLAHTTNIGFTYEIYRAVETTSDAAGGVEYVSESGATYYYTYEESSKVAGQYLNKTNDGVANDSYHETTYGSYSSGNVQKNAEPLYWQAAIKPASAQDGGNYLDYFVLHITWTEGAIKNDKETDIVYLTAGRIASE